MKKESQADDRTAISLLYNFIKVAVLWLYLAASLYNQQSFMVYFISFCLFVGSLYT